jgi:hypothetical protein
MNMLKQFLLWLLRALLPDRRRRVPPPEAPEPTPPSEPVPSPEPLDPGQMPLPKTIVTLLIFPRLNGDVIFNQVAQLGQSKYYVSSPWEVSETPINEAIRAAENWLAESLGQRIKWNRVKVVDSPRSLSEWRTGQIGLIKEEVGLLGWPWTDDYVYLAFVRGMGGYAGGIRYEDGKPGFAMVGDICLEAICNFPAPTAGSVLLGDNGWPAKSYSLTAQTGAFIHEALHGLGLPHPDGWSEGDQMRWEETLMGHWWNMPNFANTRGLTPREVERALRWNAPSV